MHQYRVKTKSRIEFVDITDQVRQAVRLRNAKSGICVVFCPHTTAGITINENADPDVPRDLEMALSNLVPEEWNWRHSEGNSDSHTKSSLFGPSLSLIIDGGALVLGTWQGVYFCEFDGPRERTFYVQIVKEDAE